MALDRSNQNWPETEVYELPADDGIPQGAVIEQDAGECEFEYARRLA